MNARISTRTRPIAVLTGAALALGACTGSDSGQGGDDTSGSAQTVEEIYTGGLHNVGDDAGDPVDGGILRVAEYSEALTLDPTKTYPTGATGMNVMAAVYDTLMRYDQKAGKQVPQLAEGLTSNDDLTVWTLTLRDGVTFSDGTPLDAAAVVDSMSYYVENRGFNGNLIKENLSSMEATDERTVTFTFTKAWGSFANLLAGGPGLILAPAAYADPKAFKPIGAGPFTVKSQSPGNKTVLMANEDYYDGRPHLDSVEFVVVGADPAKVDSLKAGEVDVVYLQQEQSIKELVTSNYPGAMHAVSGAPILSINQREGRAGHDVRVRQAISLALDGDAFLQRSVGSSDLADRSLMSDRSTWTTQVEPVTTDVDQAKKLLAEAKADGYDGKISYLGLSDPNSKAAGVATKAMLESVGFQVLLDLVGSVSEQVKKVYVDMDYDLARSSVSISDADPYAGLNQPLSSTSPVNSTGYASSEMDELLSDLRAATGPEDGLTVMTKIETLWKKDVPYVNIGAGGFLSAWNEDVHGIVPTADTAILLDEAWLRAS